ncbi:MAG: DUF1275 family protein [Gaiellaceae bacterium]
MGSSSPPSPPSHRNREPLRRDRCLGGCHGVQNAAARKLAVPDLTTTVLTMTLTGVAADSTLAGGHGSRLGRRALSVAAMLLGALIGGALVLKVDNPAPLALATVLLAVVTFVTYRASRSTPAWTHAA